MKKILLSGKMGKGLFVTVDNEDYDRLSDYKWYFVKGGKNSTTSYAGRKDKEKTIYMHRVIMNIPVGLFCHHISGNTFDNRKKNLSIVTRSTNSSLSRKNRNRKYHGISFYNRRWYALSKEKGKKSSSRMFRYTRRSCKII